jgi:hypothetical protein
MSTKVPFVSRELLDYLRRLYPDRCPDPETPGRKIWIAAGQAQVVRHLERLEKKQAADSLTPK